MTIERLPIAIVGLNFGRAICNELAREPVSVSPRARSAKSSLRWASATGTTTVRA